VNECSTLSQYGGSIYLRNISKTAHIHRAQRPKSKTNVKSIITMLSYCEKMGQNVHSAMITTRDKLTGGALGHWSVLFTHITTRLFCHTAPHVIEGSTGWNPDPRVKKRKDKSKKIYTFLPYTVINLQDMRSHWSCIYFTLHRIIPKYTSYLHCTFQDTTLHFTCLPLVSLSVATGEPHSLISGVPPHYEVTPMSRLQ
jgi:hypothetical protein